jgi:hypothetical protein
MLSVVCGYVALQRLGVTGDTPPVEIRRPSQAPAVEAANDPSNDPALRILPQNNESHDVERMSQRLDWDAPANIDSRIEFDLNGRDSLWPSGVERAGANGRVPSGPAR